MTFFKILKILYSILDNYYYRMKRFIKYIYYLFDLLKIFFGTIKFFSEKYAQMAIKNSRKIIKKLNLSKFEYKRTSKKLKA